MQNTETWLPINGYESLYSVSNNGIIKSLCKIKHTPQGGSFMSKEKILKQNITNSGYAVISLCKNGTHKTALVHLIVADHFVAKVPGKEFINHEDGKKLNNHYENLKRCTRSENMIHAFKTGLIGRRKV